MMDDSDGSKMDIDLSESEGEPDFPHDDATAAAISGCGTTLLDALTVRGASTEEKDVAFVSMHPAVAVDALHLVNNSSLLDELQSQNPAWPPLVNESNDCDDVCLVDLALDHKEVLNALVQGVATHSTSSTSSTSSASTASSKTRNPGVYDAVSMTPTSTSSDLRSRFLIRARSQLKQCGVCGKCGKRLLQTSLNEWNQSAPPIDLMTIDVLTRFECDCPDDCTCRISRTTLEKIRSSYFDKSLNHEGRNDVLFLVLSFGYIMCASFMKVWLNVGLTQYQRVLKEVISGSNYNHGMVKYRKNNPPVNKTSATVYNALEQHRPYFREMLFFHQTCTL